MKKYLFLFLIGIWSNGLAQHAEFEKEITNWRQKRLQNLLSETGWLNLAGLYWLKEGPNSIGGSEKNDCVFPTEHSKAFLGNVVLKAGKVFIEKVPKDAGINAKNGKFEGGLIYSDQLEPLVLSHQSLRWFIIKRGEKYAIRLRDLESEYVKNFKGIEHFPIQENWKLKAKFVPTSGKKLRIVDVTGRVYEEDAPGNVVFQVEGKEYALAATQEGNQLFIVFGDKTNKNETYGGGRFVYVDMPNNGNELVIDFNKAFNPPCTFTPFATCPLPVAENKLTIRIPAGEKYTSHY
ncbi:MAG: hypothetical protein RJA76_2110 [Bacteroidota bacterium]|jgi:uncharacterized protein (DUF1684 family)